MSNSAEFYIRVFKECDTEECRNIFRDGQIEHGNFLSYVDYCIRNDMGDIRSHYVTAPRSCMAIAVSKAKGLNEESNKETVVGMAAIRPCKVADIEYYERMKQTSTFDVDNEAELNRMVVIPSFRRFGVGCALINYLIDFARSQNYISIHLTTLATMTNAVSFYTRIRFVQYRYDRLVWKSDPRSDDKERENILAVTTLNNDNDEVIPEFTEENISNIPSHEVMLKHKGKGILYVVHFRYML